MKCQKCGSEGLWILHSVDVEIETRFALVHIPMDSPEYNGDGINPEYINKITLGKRNIIWASMKEKMRDSTKEERDKGWGKRRYVENLYSCKKCGWEVCHEPYELCLHEELGESE